MTYEQFQKLLDTIRYVDDFHDKVYSIGIDFRDEGYFNSIYNLWSVPLESTYTKEGLDWISWYLYELPNLKPGVHATMDGQPIDFSTDLKLYEFLEKHYRN